MMVTRRNDIVYRVARSIFHKDMDKTLWLTFLGHPVGLVTKYVLGQMAAATCAFMFTVYLISYSRFFPNLHLTAISSLNLWSPS